MESKAGERESYEGDSEGSHRKEDKDKEEDDCVTFVGQPSLAFADETKRDGQGLYLNTTLARKVLERESADDEERGHQRQTAPVTVIFDLPDGSQADEEFMLGQTVEVLKSYVESEFGIPMARQELYLGSSLLMDPMSLLDYPEVDGTRDVVVVVQGEMSAEAKK